MQNSTKFHTTQDNKKPFFLKTLLKHASNGWVTFLDESSFIREYLWKFRRLVFWGLASLIIVDLLEIFPPLLLKYTVDALSIENPWHQLKVIVLTYLVVSLLQALGRYCWRFFLVKTSMYSGRDLRDRYADHLFSLSPKFYDKKKIGDLMSLATSDIEAIRMAMGGGLIILADAVVYLITIPIAMFYLSPKLTLLCFIPLFAIPFYVVKNERKIHERFMKVQDSFSRLAVLAQENLMGIRVIKGFAREDAQIRRFTEAGKEYVKFNMDLARVQSVFGSGLDFIMSIGLVIMLYFGGTQVIDGALTLGTFIAFQRYIQKMIWPMTAVGLSITFYQRAVVGSNRFKEVLIETTETPDSKEPKLPEQKSPHTTGQYRATGKIEIKNLTFSYPNSTKPALKNLNLEIQAGSRVAFVGSIGSGKSTLVSLIPRLYAAPANSIFIDSVDINEWPLKELRKQIGFVSQEAFLFNESVFENIALGLFQKLHDEKENYVLAATHQAAIHPDILRMESGYKTLLGERGVNVSGGQKQRLTIARALAAEPPILILDDALSAVDIETETKILKGLKDRPGRNTEIVCAHRLSTVRDADWIYVFSDGGIAQSGTHETLLREKNNIYWRFYEQQRLQQEVENYIGSMKQYDNF